MCIPIPALLTDGLLAADEFAGVTATVMDNNPGMSEALAGRIVTEALKFVVTAARHPEAPIAPSRVVDEGWHALILHTALYRRVCSILGRFVDHYPERPDPSRQGADVIEQTLAMLRADGHDPDLPLWTTPVDNHITVAAPCGHGPRCGPIDPAPQPPGVLAGAS